MYCNDWLDTSSSIEVLNTISDILRKSLSKNQDRPAVENWHTINLPFSTIWQLTTKEKAWKSSFTCRKSLFFLREIMTEKLALFFTLFQIGTTPVCARFLSFAGAKSVFVGPNLTMVSKILVVQPAQIRYIGVEDLSHKPLFWATRNTLALGHKNRAVALLTSNKPAPLERRTRF